MANSLTSAQRQELKDAFDVFDSGMRYNYQEYLFTRCICCWIDGSGKISGQELGNIFKALNVKVNDNQLKQLVSEMDSDGSGM